MSDSASSSSASPSPEPDEIVLQPVSQSKAGPEEGIGSYAATYETFVFQGKISQDFDESYLRRCFDLRIQTFYVEQRFPIDTEFDELRNRAVVC